MTEESKQKFKELVQLPCSSQEVADEMTKIMDAEVSSTGKLAVLYLMSACDQAFDSPFLESYLDMRPELCDWIAGTLFNMKDSPEIDDYRRIGDEWMKEMGFPKKEKVSQPNEWKEHTSNEVKEKTKVVVNENLLSKLKKDPALLVKTAREIIDSHFQSSPITKEILTLALKEL